MTELIWLSDLHFSSKPLFGLDPETRIRAAIDFINTIYPEAAGVIISGDLCEKGLKPDYEALAPLLNQLSAPWFPMAGNHDNRSYLRPIASLPKNYMTNFLQYRLELNGAEILCLDTVKDGAHDGEFCQERLDWLARQLARPKVGPRLIFMHHPPFEIDIPVLDAIRLKESEPLLDLICAEGAADYLCCGHVHRPTSGSIRGLPFSTLRSLMFQAPLPRPKWDFDHFVPAEEAPDIGAINWQNSQITINFVEPFPGTCGRTDAPT